MQSNLGTCQLPKHCQCASLYFRLKNIWNGIWLRSGHKMKLTYLGNGAFGAHHWDQGSWSGCWTWQRVNSLEYEWHFTSNISPQDHIWFYYWILYMPHLVHIRYVAQVHVGRHVLPTVHHILHLAHFQRKYSFPKILIHSCI